MNERIAQVRQSLGLTQFEFAARLGLSQNFIWMLEKGEREPSNRTILDMCEKFGVQEKWLRTGEGEMFLPMSRADEIHDFIGKILTGEPDFRQKFVTVLARMSPDEWAMLERKAKELLAEMETPPQE